MTVPAVVIKGRIERKEFAEPFRQCAKMLETIGVQYHVNPASTNEPEDFALFFQSYPHEFSSSDLEQLRRANPFAPFFFVLGVCCEGMLRTAAPLASPFYCYVHAWNDGETEQIRLFLTEQPSIFALPMTAENDEIAVSRIVCDALESRTAGGAANCLILTQFGPFGNDSAMNQLIADEQRRLGYKPVLGGKMLPESFSGKIFADVDDSPREKILDSIQRTRRRFADNEFTVYVDSPRIDEKEDYVQAGVTMVLPKMR